MTQIGKWMMVFGVVFVIAGLAMQFIGRIPGVGRLPGDILIKRESFTFYFPFMTCLIASVVLSLLLSLFMRR